MPKFKKPTSNSVARSVRLIKSSPKYIANMDALQKLFETYPKNTKFDEVYLKVVALNEMYSTNIYNPYKVALGIWNLKIDKDLQKNTIGVINKIAKNHSIKTASGSKRNFYSFATKYCSWHVADYYPIYDSYVATALISYRNSHRFAQFTAADLKKYRKFRKVIDLFRSEFRLEAFALREIDLFLWSKGKVLIQNRHKG